MHRPAVKRILFSLLLWLLFLPDTQAQAQTDSPEYCQDLLLKGKAAIENSDYLLSLKYFTKAHDLAAEKDWKEKLFFAKNGIGAVYENLLNFGEAIGYYKQALQIATELNNQELQSVVYNNIGVVYSRDKDFKNALVYYNKAFKISNNDNKVLLGINIADIYIKTGNYIEARKSLMNVDKLPMPVRLRQGWKLNYAHTLLVENKLDEALAMLEPLVKEVNTADEIVFPELAIRLSQVHERQNNSGVAIMWAEKGLHGTPNMNARIDLYNNLSELHYNNGEYLKSKQYKDSVITAKDSLAALKNRNLFESNKVKLKIQEYQNELLGNKQRQAAERKLYITGIILFILLFLFIYRGLKNKLDKQKQEKVLAETRQKIMDMELEGLKNNIAEKNRKLSAKALYLSGRNELIDEVITSLAKLPEVSYQQTITEYIKNLKAYIKTDDQWDDFIRYFEETNPKFIQALTATYSELNPSDIRFICYVYMNLDTKEIGNIFNITYNAAKKRKARIKEKMGIDNESSLYEFLLALSKNMD